MDGSVVEDQAYEPFLGDPIMSVILCTGKLLIALACLFPSLHNGTKMAHEADDRIVLATAGYDHTIRLVEHSSIVSMDRP